LRVALIVGVKEKFDSSLWHVVLSMTSVLKGYVIKRSDVKLHHSVGTII